MRKLGTLAFVALAAAAAAAAPLALAQAQKAAVSGGVATAPGHAKAGAMVTAAAVVQAVDPATRTVTLKLGNGEVRSIVASDEVRNFDQIKVGDTVKVKYAEAVSIELKKGAKAAPGTREETTMKRAEPGQKPGGVAVREVTVVADVVAVDAAKHKVTIKKGNGEEADLEVQDPEQLKLVKVGDQVEAKYTQALAISLTPAKPEAPKAEAKKK